MPAQPPLGIPKCHPLEEDSLGIPPAVQHPPLLFCQQLTLLTVCLLLALTESKCLKNRHHCVTRALV